MTSLRCIDDVTCRCLDRGWDGSGRGDTGGRGRCRARGAAADHHGGGHARGAARDARLDDRQRGAPDDRREHRRLDRSGRVDYHRLRDLQRRFDPAQSDLDSPLRAPALLHGVHHRVHPGIAVLQHRDVARRVGRVPRAAGRVRRRVDRDVAGRHAGHVSARGRRRQFRAVRDRPDRRSGGSDRSPAAT